MDTILQISVNGLLTGMLYSLVGASIVLVYKATRVVSMAHGQLLALGALSFWVFVAVMEIPPLGSFLLTMVVAGSMGFLVERVTIRPLIGQPLFTAFLVTFALFIFLDGAFQLYVRGRTLTYPPFLPEGAIPLGPLAITKSQVISFFIGFLLFLILAVIFKYTKIGLGMRATAQDHRLAQNAGVRVRKIFSFIWILSAMVASIAGIAWAIVMDIHYGLASTVIKGLIVALFGGLESLGGALLAGILLGLFETMSAGYLDPVLGGGVKDMAAYVLLLFILLVRPYGLFGMRRIERI